MGTWHRAKGISMSNTKVQAKSHRFRQHLSNSSHIKRIPANPSNVQQQRQANASKILLFPCNSNYLLRIPTYSCKLTQNQSNSITIAGASIIKEGCGLIGMGLAFGLGMGMDRCSLIVFTLPLLALRPMSHGPVLRPMALSYFLWPRPMFHGPILCPVSHGPALSPMA